MAFFPVFAHRSSPCRDAHAARDAAVRTRAISPGKRGSTRTDEVAANSVFINCECVLALSERCARDSGCARSEACEQLACRAAAARTSTSLSRLVTPRVRTSVATRRRELARENSHQSFIRRAIDGRSGHAHEKAPVAHASEAFRRGARTHAQAQNQVRALHGAPRAARGQGTQDQQRRSGDAGPQRREIDARDRRDDAAKRPQHRLAQRRRAATASANSRPARPC